MNLFDKLSVEAKAELLKETDNEIADFILIAEDFDNIGCFEAADMIDNLINNLVRKSSDLGRIYAYTIRKLAQEDISKTRFAKHIIKKIIEQKQTYDEKFTFANIDVPEDLASELRKQGLVDKNNNPIISLFIIRDPNFKTVEVSFDNGIFTVSYGDLKKIDRRVLNKIYDSLKELEKFYQSSEPKEYKTYIPSKPEHKSTVPQSFRTLYPGSPMGLKANKKFSISKRTK